MFKKKTKWASKPVEPTPPRSKEDINAEYSKLVGEAGQTQFHVYALKERIEQINARIQRIAMEMDEREKLDAKEGDSGSKDQTSST